MKVKLEFVNGIMLNFDIAGLSYMKESDDAITFKNIDEQIITVEKCNLLYFILKEDK